MTVLMDELIKQIEELRNTLIKIKEGKAYTDPEVVAASQKLDEVLNKYQELKEENEEENEEENDR